MKKTISLMLAALLLFCTVMPAMAAENQDVQEISGQVLASELRDDATIKLTGDTVLTLDTDKSIMEINDPGENGHSLTIEGAATLTVKIGINEDRIILNSGKINLSDAYQIPCVSANFITINGGELYINSGSSGLDAREELNISGGKLEIHAGYAGIGIKVMNVSGGEVYTSGYFVAIGGFGSWSGMISGCKLNVTGGYVEATAIKTLDESWTVGSALSGLSIDGGTLKMSGSLTAVNCWDAPVEIGRAAKIQSPAGAYVSTYMTDTEQSDYGWSGYSILNADGSRVTEVVISGSSSLCVLVNSTAVEWTDAVPFIDENGRTMVPLRAVGDALGLTVDWNGASREAVFTNGTKTIYFPIDSTVARTSDGQSIQMDTAAVIVNGRTYAPVRYLAEYFDFDVAWDAETRTVIIQKLA